MADTITVVEIVQFPHFMGIIDGKPAIGALLYAYAPETSTPKATYRDPGLVTPNTHPVVMDDQGSALVYLKDRYRLRFTNAEGTLYWEVDNYAFPASIEPPPGDVIMGSTEATVQPTPGAPSLTFSNMAPAGYRVLGLTWTTTVAWGTANGLHAIAVGDSTLIDRWAVISDLSQGITGGQLGFHDASEPIAAPAAYTVIASALGGSFDGTGSLHITTYWSSLPADSP